MGRSRFFYQIRDLAGNARLAIAHELADGAPILESVRNHIALGQLETSKDLLNSSSVHQLEQSDRTEYLFESARIAFHEGQYIQTVHFATLTLDQSPSPVTRMSAYQVRAAAYFETQKWSECLSDIQRSEALSILFANEAVTFNLRALRIRLDLRKRNFEDGKKILSDWFTEYSRSNDWTLDRLHQFERIQIDLRRLHGYPFLENAFKSFLYAKALGDAVFIELARVDIWTSSLAKRGSEVSGEPLIFTKSQALVAEGRGVSVALSETGRCILNYIENCKLEPNDLNLLYERTQPISFILDHKLQLLVNLENLGVTNLSSLPQVQSALVALSSGIISKQCFFELLWPGIKFDVERHDATIRTLISRIRKKTNLPIECIDGNITTLQGIWVIN